MKGNILDEANFKITTRLLLAEEILRSTLFLCPKGCGEVEWELHNDGPTCVICGEEVDDLIPRAWVEYIKKFPTPVTNKKWSQDEITLTFSEIKKINKMLDGGN